MKKNMKILLLITFIILIGIGIGVLVNKTGIYSLTKKEKDITKEITIANFLQDNKIAKKENKYSFNETTSDMVISEAETLLFENFKNDFFNTNNKNKNDKIEQLFKQYNFNFENYPYYSLFITDDFTQLYGVFIVDVIMEEDISALYNLINELKKQTNNETTEKPLSFTVKLEKNKNLLIFIYDINNTNKEKLFNEYNKSIKQIYGE